MAWSDLKALQRFRLRIKDQNIMRGDVFFLSGTTGHTIPSGVLIFNTTTNKLMVGCDGSTAETITSA
jgi:hypothetical protein